MLMTFSFYFIIKKAEEERHIWVTSIFVHVRAFLHMLYKEKIPGCLLTFFYLKKESAKNI